MKNATKRVGLSLYMDETAARRIDRNYAASVLNGYNGTRQQFLNELIDGALSKAERERERERSGVTDGHNV